MANKKVYLAKSPLASGLDFDLVKSHLLRIPDIELIEFKSGIPVEKCKALVIIAKERPSDEGFCYVERNLTSTIEEFLGVKDIDRVLVFTNTIASDISSDVESILVQAETLVDLESLDEDAKTDNNYDCSLYLGETYSLVGQISDIINSDSSWRKIPVRFTPKEIYAVKASSLEQVRNVKTQGRQQNIMREKLMNIENKRPLLRRKR